MLFVLKLILFQFVQPLKCYLSVVFFFFHFVFCFFCSIFDGCTCTYFHWRFKPMARDTMNSIGAVVYRAHYIVNNINKKKVFGLVNLALFGKCVCVWHVLNILRDRQEAHVHTHTHTFTLNAKLYARIKSFNNKKSTPMIIMYLFDLTGRRFDC